MIIFRWIWNLLLIIVVIALFIPYWILIFGEVWPAILILIFNPGLFLLPALIFGFWSENKEGW